MFPSLSHHRRSKCLVLQPRCRPTGCASILPRLQRPRQSHLKHTPWCIFCAEIKTLGQKPEADTTGQNFVSWQVFGFEIRETSTSIPLVMHALCVCVCVRVCVRLLCADMGSGVGAVMWPTWCAPKSPKCENARTRTCERTAEGIQQLSGENIVVVSNLF